MIFLSTLTLFHKGLRPEKRYVRRKSGRVHQQTFHIQTGEKSKQDKTETLTLMSMMQKYSTNLNTDEAKVYMKPGRKFASHDVVKHSDEEYSRKDKKTGRRASTNTVEGYYGNTKRSIAGTHHAISPQHTALYIAETDHKYNTRKMSDSERTKASIKRIGGKRLKRKEMHERRFKVPKGKLVEKAVVANDKMQMPAEKFDNIMRGVLSKPFKPGDSEPVVKGTVRIVKKSKKVE